MILGLRRAAMLVAVSLALLSSAPSFAAAQTAIARGRLQRIVNLQGAWAPVPGLVVTLRAVNGVRSTPAYAGADGMYYLYNVPQGDYILEVWYPGTATPFLNVPIRLIYVFTPNGPLFDIPPINIP